MSALPVCRPAHERGAQVVTRRLLGRYAQASGEPRSQGGADPEWLAGWLEGETNRLIGRDPAGHPPNLPQLCARDVRKVCNCCGSCRRACPLDTYPPAVSLRGLLGRLLSNKGDKGKCE